ncbi:MAG: sulfatase [Litorilinea sp.]
MPSHPPNILFVMTDDQTVREMSCYGDSLFATPNMDRLANEGTLFANCFATNALCAPSRATVLTGAFSHVHGIRGNSEQIDAVEELDPNVPTFPELLQKAGYQTALVGKYHIRQDPRGFDYWAIHPGQGEYFDPVFIENGSRIQKQGYATDITGDLALDVLEKRDRARPFCLVYQFKAPHRPFTPAPRHAHLFEDLEIPEPPTFHDDYATRTIAQGAEDMRLELSLAGDYADLPPDLDAAAAKRWIFQRFMKDRMRTLVSVDENLGRVLDYLDAEGLTQDTLVIYTSDHGYFLGEHGWYDKRFMYEPAMRIPLVARYPRRGVSGHVVQALTMNIDFAPTILDYAGVEQPATVQGVSLRPLLEGNVPPDWRQSVYYAYYEDSWMLAGKGDEAMAEPYRYFTPHRVGPHRGVRTQRYKLIEYYGEGDYWELFDLDADPHELHNRYADPAFAEIEMELKQELARLRAYYHDVEDSTQTQATQT